MNISDLLTQQHREANALFEAFRQAPEDDKAVLSIQLAESLTVYSTIERQWLYPVLSQVMGEDFVRQSQEEDNRMRKLIGEVVRARQGTRELDDTVRELESVVKDHISKEERNLLPQLGQKISEEELGISCDDIIRNALQARREELMKLGDAMPSS